ncbi:MAG: hypothetical protein ABJQ70_14030 [Roseobacter sp.]
MKILKTDLWMRFWLILDGKTWFNYGTTLAIKALRAAAWVSGAFLLTA